MWSEEVKYIVPINRMPLSTYNALDKNKELCANQLYFIDDISEFDVKNMRIVNVAIPENGTDAVNVLYADENYIQIANLSSHLKDNWFYNQKY